jgi:signal peptidase
MAARHLSRHITWRKALPVAAGVVVFAVWFLMLRPSVLGGPATYSIVSGHSMEPTYQEGDYVITIAQGEYHVGDIVMFEVPGGRVIHRIVGDSAETGFVTQGDNNPAIDPWQPSPESILGEAWVHVPELGNVIAMIRGPLGIGVMAWVLTTGAVLRLTAPRGRHQATASTDRRGRREWEKPTRRPGRRARPNRRPETETFQHVTDDTWPPVSPRPGRL